MTTFRGQDGYLCIGGALFTTAGNVLNNGAKTVGATTISIDGTGLVGVVVPGDTFTVAGETGSPVHTVTGSAPLAAAAGAINNIPFTPAIATGGIADNAVVTFASNSMAKVRTWNHQASLDVIEDTGMGDPWKTNQPGVAEWSGSGEAFLDYLDPAQKRLIDKLLTATPSPTVAGVLFGVNPRKQVYGAAILSGFQISGSTGNMFTITFNFTGTGAAAPDWN
jgi:hypothetical protein